METSGELEPWLRSEIRACQKLWFAVILAMAHDYFSNDEWIRRQAQAWFKNKAEEPFNCFRGLCRELGLSADAIYRGLEKRKELYRHESKRTRIRNSLRTRPQHHLGDQNQGGSMPVV